MPRKNAQNTTENGNALFIILIIVVLLGLLTTVLSRGGSNVEQTGSIEQDRVAAGQIQRYARSIEAAAQEMQLRDISENDISFENPSTTFDYTNPNCNAADDRSFPQCLLFNVEGAGLVYRNFPNANDGNDWIFTSANNVGRAENPVGETAERSGNDLVMLLPNARQSLCILINRDLDIGVGGTLPIDTTGIATTEFIGSFPGGGLVTLDGDPTPFELDGRHSGCFTDGDSGITYFYHVILAR